nr:biotin carboxyl carrier protein of acetyl-CoA carboxylase [Ipomoea batatas]
MLCKNAAKKSSDGNHKEVFSSPAVSQLIPYSREIQNLLTEFSDSESIAEFQIKIGEFELHVMRNLNGKSTPPPPITAPLTVTVSTAAEAPNSYSSISTTSLALGKPLVTPREKDALLARAAEEGFVVIQSPRVGFFRRSRTVKGKSGPPSCKENQVVDEGQILCYVDQLGGEMPIEADISGEVVSILLEDGVKLEASTLQITSLNLGSARPKFTAFGAVKIQSLLKYNGLLISSKPKKPLVGCLASTPEAQSVEAPNSNTSISTPSLVSPAGKDALHARASEEGFVVIQSPWVGLFRRCGTLKGKIGPPCCKENQVVDENQVLCYIDQLGWEIPIKADVCGEVVSILLEDGAPVGYGDPLMIILPSSPGVKELP